MSDHAARDAADFGESHLREAGAAAKVGETLSEVTFFGHRGFVSRHGLVVEAVGRVVSGAAARQ
jgi:hypothetical protein